MKQADFLFVMSYKKKLEEQEEVHKKYMRLAKKLQVIYNEHKKLTEDLKHDGNRFDNILKINKMETRKK